MKKIIEQTKKITRKTIDALKKISKKYLNPRAYRPKESDKQHGCTFRDERHKGPKI